METMQEAIDWLYSQPRGLKRQNFDVINTAIQQLAIDVEKLNIIHVAGTNGKGSTTAYMNAILQAHGKSSACFTSPHIMSINERFVYNSQPISDEEFIQHLKAVQQLQTEFAQFEIMTLVFFLFVQQRDVDFVILEVGIGGLNDVTNFIHQSTAVITTIGIDHTELLGDTIEEIAYQKAGIIKPNQTVFIGQVGKVAQDVILKVAESKNADCHFVPVASQPVHYDGHDYVPSITGVYQKDNLHLALNVCEYVLSHSLSPEAVREGLSKVYWPGRFEKLVDEPTVFVDGAHNLHGVMGLIETLQSNAFHQRDITILFGALPNKDYEGMLMALQEHFPVYFTEFDYVKTQPVTSYDHLPDGISVVEDYKKFVFDGIKEKTFDCLVVTGSLYFVSEFKNIVENEFKSCNL
ncbi:hypothetical protein KG090_05245 [Carnobacteriaceae bacterium zg-ZUI240]|nr:hypothetical protein [Carnobacteriaceae bacterium zg-ZUI240]